MRLKHLGFTIASILTTIAVGLFSSYAMAANQCSRIFVSEMSNHEPLAEIKNLQMTHVEFLDFLSARKGQTLEPAELSHWIQRAEKATTEYFENAGIQFTRESVVHEGIDFNGVKIPRLAYDVYKIVESKQEGSPNALFFNGVLKNSKLKSLSLIYDPFLSIRQAGVSGYFLNSPHQIWFSWNSLVGRRWGTGDTLRHEVQHAFEYQKIREGRPTLASFQFIGKEKREEAYSDFMSLDEIETHLRDVRFLKNIVPRLEKSAHLESWQSLNTYRRNAAKDDIARLKSLISRAKVALAEIEANPNASLNHESGDQNVSTFFLSNPHYKLAAFIAKAGEPPPTPAFVKDRVHWAQERIQQIEKEIQLLEANL
ncbi:hypothetical protein D3C87_102960 [compost metagenome]